VFISNMVDTIRFKISITPEIAHALLKSSLTSCSINVDGSSNSINFFKTIVSLPSYQSDVNLMVQPNTVFLEFSLPKLVLKTNIFLVARRSVSEAVEHVYLALKQLAPDFPLSDVWAVQRLDCCYNWFTHSEEIAKQLLEAVRKSTIEKKHRVAFDTSFSDIGSWYTMKFYLKHPEFMANSYSQIKKLYGVELAYELSEASKGVLRYEVELRKEQLIKEFGEDLRWGVIKEKLSITMRLLTKYLDKYSMHIVNLTNIEEAQKVLEQKYGESKAIRLITFLQYPKIAKKFYSRKTIYTYKKMLKDAQVNLISQTPFKLEIPEVWT